MKYRYRGGPLDGEQVETPRGPDGPHDIVRAPMPTTRAARTGEVELPSHVEYRRVRVANGDAEYWTAAYCDEQEQRQQPLAARLDRLTAVVKAQADATAELSGVVDRLQAAFDDLDRRLTGMHNEQQQAPDVQRLGDYIARVETRLDSALAANDLWDGS